MQNIWIIIWRFNPLHIWHISLINASLSKSDKTIIILWSANIINENNPFTKEERAEILRKEFLNEIEIDFLDDFDSNEDWINNLLKIINKYTNNSDKLSFFWGDLKNDFAIKVITKYLDVFNYSEINFFEKDRLEIPISATQVRKMLKNNENPEKWIWQKTKDLIIKKFLK